MPDVKAFAGSYQTLGMVAHNLGELDKEGLVKRIGGRYLMRDACPLCFRRGGCTAECGLHFGVEFSPRRLDVVL